jgi:hypothetical protein
VRDALVRRLGRPAFRMLHVRMPVVEPNPGHWGYGCGMSLPTCTGS